MPIEKCYPSGTRAPFRVAGCALVAVGAILLFLCVPGWAWVALIGVGLIAAGLLLLKLSGAGR